jgi:outer membrane murein-binding lipoprotein Lpp
MSTPIRDFASKWGPVFVTLSIGGAGFIAFGEFKTTIADMREVSAIVYTNRTSVAATREKANAAYDLAIMANQRIDDYMLSKAVDK